MQVSVKLVNLSGLAERSEMYIRGFCEMNFPEDMTISHARSMNNLISRLTRGK